MLGWDAGLAAGFEPRGSFLLFRSDSDASNKGRAGRPPGPLHSRSLSPWAEGSQKPADDRLA